MLERYRLASDPKIVRGPCTFPKCGRASYALGLCRGHYAQHKRGVSPLHTLREPGAPALEVLSVRVSPRAKAKASADPEGVRRVIERWANAGKSVRSRSTDS